jgi:hypothetical protein
MMEHSTTTVLVLSKLSIPCDSQSHNGNLDIIVRTNRKALEQL